MHVTCSYFVLYLTGDSFVSLGSNNRIGESGLTTGAALRLTVVAVPRAAALKLGQMAGSGTGFPDKTKSTSNSTSEFDLPQFPGEDFLAHVP